MTDSKALAFLAEFDAYVAIRDQLKAAEEGSEDEQLCIHNCGHQWGRVIAARNALSVSA